MILYYFPEHVTEHLQIPAILAIKPRTPTSLTPQPAQLGYLAEVIINFNVDPPRYIKHRYKNPYTERVTEKLTFELLKAEPLDKCRSKFRFNASAIFDIKAAN